MAKVEGPLLTRLAVLLRSADVLLNKVCMVGFDRSLRLEPSPLKLPLKFAAETLPNKIQLRPQN